MAVNLFCNPCKEFDIYFFSNTVSAEQNVKKICFSDLTQCSASLIRYSDRCNKKVKWKY